MYILHCIFINKLKQDSQKKKSIEINKKNILIFTDIKIFYKCVFQGEDRQLIEMSFRLYFALNVSPFSDFLSTVIISRRVTHVPKEETYNKLTMAYSNLS